MLSPLDLRGVTGDLRPLLPRPDHAGPTAAEVEAVTAVLRAVREGGDHAVRELTSRFDGVDIGDLRVAPAAIADALNRIAPDLRAALEAAHDSIAAYHQASQHEAPVHVRNGISVRALTVPVARAGCYVPGGRAVYPSTVLMTATIAAVAGVDEIVLCVPPDRTTGRPPDAVLAAAAIAGVSEVYRVGGAQAIAAMAYGTESIRPVDVIVGPGNV
jgi:histidinol dehydrogenase